MDKRQEQFERTLIESVGTQLWDATNIANSAVYMLMDRSTDLGINPLMTLIIATKLIDRNATHIKDHMCNDKSMQLLSKVLGQDMSETIERMETMADNLVKTCGREEKRRRT